MFRLKFIYSEKVPNEDLTVTTQDKSTVEISQNCVAFSEYMNFKYLHYILPSQSHKMSSKKMGHASYLGNIHKSILLLFDVIWLFCLSFFASSHSNEQCSTEIRIPNLEPNFLTLFDTGFERKKNAHIQRHKEFFYRQNRCKKIQVM